MPLRRIWRSLSCAAATTEGPLLHAKFHPHRCNVSPLRGEKPQNRPLSKLNTGRFALRGMLPVIIPVGSLSEQAKKEEVYLENGL